MMGRKHVTLLVDYKLDNDVICIEKLTSRCLALRAHHSTTAYNLPALPPPLSLSPFTYRSLSLHMSLFTYPSLSSSFVIVVRLVPRCAL